MTYQSITTVVTEIDADLTAVRVAQKIAAQNNGHLEVLCIGIDNTQPGYYYTGANAMVLQSNFELAEQKSGALETSIKAELENCDAQWNTRAMTAQLPGLGPFLAQGMRFMDLAVLPQPYGAERGHESEVLIEAALFDAKIPVLVVPDNYSCSKPFARVVIAWNDSPEALTAVRHAVPVLRQADEVSIVIIDPPSHALDRSDPGGALALKLARYGISAEVSVVAKTLPRVSNVIARFVADKDADLLVMGAYGHSRIRESILGGATRNTLEMAKLPVLMAH